MYLIVSAEKGYFFLYHVIYSIHRVEFVQNKSEGTASSFSHDSLSRVGSIQQPGCFAQGKSSCFVPFVQKGLSKLTSMLNRILPLYSWQKSSMSPIPHGPGDGTHFLGSSEVVHFCFSSASQSMVRHSLCRQLHLWRCYHPPSVVVQTPPNSTSWRIRVGGGIYSCFIVNPYSYLVWIPLK